jgi:hypothetical protein
VEATSIYAFGSIEHREVSGQSISLPHQKEKEFQCNPGHDGKKAVN